ncbi:hypothetical protein GCM10010191_08450 [Actinomadura vinacea]|uniref:Aldehyde oxidase/xanthine dehydrogenase second molybdopterin binding domain-containing protein n=1 Tax=Actinomadura vinacea TaxID=115336 RepID=A0ABN3IF98_9ACTN
MTAGAVTETARILREKIVALAAHRLEAVEGDIELARARAHVRGTPSAGIDHAELAEPAYFRPEALPPGQSAGPMINPNVVEGQIAGGTVQGIGGALLEHLAHDDDGNPLATTFMDYLLPTTTEVPSIEYGHLEIPGPGPGGHKGVGEGGAIGAPPAHPEEL